jgi:hypothetical protein
MNLLVPDMNELLLYAVTDIIEGARMRMDGMFC